MFGDACVKWRVMLIRERKASSEFVAQFWSRSESHREDTIMVMMPDFESNQGLNVFSCTD